MSIDACKAALRAAINGITPTSDSSHGFVSTHSRTHGRRISLEDLQSGYRHFVVMADGWPTEVEGDLRTCRMRQAMLVRVRYENDKDADRLETLISEDVCAIVKALRKPSNWNQGVSGLRSLQFEPGTPTDRVGDDGNPVAYIANIAFTITYRDC